MADKADAEKAPTPSGLAGAANRMRDAAKWIIGAFAAVGTVLAAGLQLGDLGSLDDSDVARLVAALLGVAVVVIGIAFAIYYTSQVLTSGYASLRLLASDKDFADAREIVDADTALRGGYPSAAALADRVDLIFPKEQQLWLAINDKGPDGETAAQRDARLAPLLTEYKAVGSEAATLTQIRNHVVELASFTQVRLAYENAKKWMFVGAALAAIGVSAFAWAANPPESTSIAGGEILPKTPSNVVVIMSDKGKTEFQATLGAKCDLGNVQAVATAVKGDVYTVVSVKTDDCATQLMEIGPARGQVVPPPAAAKAGSDAKAKAAS